ncbi:delta 5 fatty acid desaturase [Dictyostelium purpureum]|uniref:Delta 5 fatty acid desaturase n=1 Tax=Dictyostelium purpureum TaxID=5786 RepID=F0ZDC0_DICPU|nr:delta 5 fatty acid desaturase [Dictyostelium purpureum]EGC38083.1 delta 5 fatty acid desaturase [Dictyostelium purpureum]|eukprot:XP_003285390.1 delta 5 fatty acid desaturase [Dictyostelium purpureum]
MSKIQGKQYSWTEIAKHNTENDCWVAVDGKVYDISKWVSQHPGGKEVLMLGAGRDVTNLFESYHPMSDKPSAILKNYEIGFISSYEHPRYVQKSDFYKTLKDRVRKHFKTTDQDPQKAVAIFSRLALVYVLIICSYILAHYTTNNFYLNCFFAVLYALANSLFSMHMMHDSCHAAVSHSPTVWKWMGASFDFFTGASFYAWCHQHVIGHHLYTNIRNADPDLGQGEIDFRIVTPYQTRAWYHKYQHIYAPILYGLYTYKYRLQDYEAFLKGGKNGAIRTSPASTFDLAAYVIGKISFIFFRFILPLRYHNLFDLLVYFVICETIFGWYLTINFQVSHVAEDLKFYGTPEQPDEPAQINEDWAILQIKTTQDYGHGSVLCTFFSGGLNHQVVHHLFPSICQDFYPQLVPILKDVCKEYNLTYHIKPTFTEAITSHINYLYKMGNDPDYVKKPMASKDN